MRRASTATGGTRRRPRDLAVASSPRHPNGHRGPFSCYRGHLNFSVLSITGSLIRRRIDLAACDHNTGATDFALTSRRRCLRTTAGKCAEGSTFSNLREVIMTMSEYEERFRPPAPSLHQTLAQVRGSNRGGRRNRRLWVAAALVGVVTITSKAALHHSTYANGSQITGIQACDFIHR